MMIQIRCVGCQRCLWLRDPRKVEDCPACGHRHDLAAEGWLATLENLSYEKVQTHALKRGIDIPGAYSALLGLAPRSVTPEAPAGKPKPQPLPAVDSARVDFDPAFIPAIESGHLTVRQALERGNRESYALRLVQRHRLPWSLAYSVSDNRVALLEAIRRCEAKTPRPKPPRSRAKRRPLRRRWPAVASIGAAVALLTLLGMHTVSRTAHASASPVVERDAQGRIVRIAGSDPQAVLDAYCAAGDRLVSRGISPSTMPSSRVRVGVLSDDGRANTLLAIPIRHDTSRGIWFAGDGRSPLRPMRAPTVAGAS